MSQDYDVFANLYDNDKDDKAKFLEKLESRKADMLNNDSSDEEDLLPPSLRTKAKGRAKNSKAPAKKVDALAKDISPTKKSKTTDAQTAEDSFQQQLQKQTSHSDALVPSSRRSTRRSTPGTSQETASSTTTVTTSAPARGRKGRRGTNRAAINTPDLENVNAAVIADSLDVFAAMMRGRSTRRNVMRARRTYFAEIAARSTNVDYVDLVSSPLPHIEGVVTVDSDGEESRSSNSVEITGTKTLTPNTSIAVPLNCSFDEDNPEISVKIKWDGGNPEIFQLRKHQKFHSIFNEIAERENTPINNIVFNIDNRIISPSDTPASINYKIYEFMSGRVLTDLFDVGTVRKKRDANVITLKIQSDLWPKRPLKVELNKTDKLKILYIKCAEELKMPAEDLVLSFNGDHLGFNDTPEAFELEGDEAIDLRVKKK